MSDIEKNLRQRFEYCGCWPVSRNEMQLLFAELDRLRAALDDHDAK